MRELYTLTCTLLLITKCEKAVFLILQIEMLILLLRLLYFYEKLQLKSFTCTFFCYNISHLGWLSPEDGVLFRMLQQIHKLHKLNLGLLEAGHVAELDAPPLTHPWWKPCLLCLIPTHYSYIPVYLHVYKTASTVGTKPVPIYREKLVIALPVISTVPYMESRYPHRFVC